MTSCVEVRELAPELALGAVDGAERAAALGHLAGCPSCRGYVAALGEIADALLLMSPESDPPVGFESRVRRATTSRRRLRWPVVAAAALLLVAGVGVATRSEPSRVRSGPMYDEQHRAVGYAAVYTGRAPFVSVRVDGWGESGTYTVELVLRDKRHVALTPIHLVGGRGTAGAPLTMPVDHIRAVWVTDPDRSAWCSFRL